MSGEKTFISVRIDADVKDEAEEVLREMGMNISTAVNIYLHTVIRKKAIPFEVRLEDDITEIS